jgi:hypothetical protein
MLALWATVVAHSFQQVLRFFLPLVAQFSRFILHFPIVIVFRANGASFLSPRQRPISANLFGAPRFGACACGGFPQALL